MTTHLSVTSRGAAKSRRYISPMCCPKLAQITHCVWSKVAYGIQHVGQEAYGHRTASECPAHTTKILRSSPTHREPTPRPSTSPPPAAAHASWHCASMSMCHETPPKSGTCQRYRIQSAHSCAMPSTMVGANVHQGTADSTASKTTMPTAHKMVARIAHMRMHQSCTLLTLLGHGAT